MDRHLSTGALLCAWHATKPPLAASGPAPTWQMPARHARLGCRAAANMALSRSCCSSTIKLSCCSKAGPAACRGVSGSGGFKRVGFGNGWALWVIVRHILCPPAWAQGLRTVRRACAGEGCRERHLPAAHLHGGAHEIEAVRWQVLVRSHRGCGPGTTGGRAG